jgi:hypothetical protein
MGLVLAKVLKMISILLVVATTSGIVLPVAWDIRADRPRTWQVEQMYNHCIIQHWNVSISLPYRNKVFASLQIECSEFQLDHPTCWRGYGDCAIPGLVPVVAREVGRLDNTSARWRQIGAHISAVTSFSPSYNRQEKCREQKLIRNVRTFRKKKWQKENLENPRKIKKLGKIRKN